MLKKRFIFILFFISFQLCFSQSVKKAYEVKSVPISIAIKHILQQASSEKMTGVVKKNSVRLDLSIVKKLQATTKKLVEQTEITYADIVQIRKIIESMKQSVIQSPDQTKREDALESSKQLAQELSADAAILLNSLANDADYEMQDLQKNLLLLQQDLLNNTVNKKVVARFLSTIQEVLQKYDGVFISAYKVVALSQVALIVYLLEIAYS